MTWTLADGVGFVEAGQEFLFLDIQRDRYLLLTGERGSAFARLVSGEPNDSDAMAALIETGLFKRGDRPRTLESLQLEVPRCDLRADPATRTTMRQILAAASALRWARGALKPARLKASVDGLAGAKSTAPHAGDEERLYELAARFRAARIYVPIAPRCLIDSLALYRMAVRKGFAPTLVFGVRTTPFAAHCWLQSRSTILTGTAEEARNFRPILTI